MKAPTYAPTTPAWCRYVRRYLRGDTRSGWRARSSVTRWRRRMFPSREGRS